jgi:hypothetical protein
LNKLISPTFTVTTGRQLSSPTLTIALDNERADAAVSTLQQPAFFTAGVYPQALQWTSTTIGTFLIDFLTVTNLPNADASNYFNQFVQFYKKQPVFSLLFQQYDDQQWVVLTYLRAAIYSKTAAPEWTNRFLCRAKLFYNLARKGWDNKSCGGGMYWGPTSTYKNAVTTELFITASVMMYEEYGTRSYLDAAIRGWVWFNASGMINAQGLVNDGLDGTCRYDPTESTDEGIMGRRRGHTIKELYYLD